MVASVRGRHARPSSGGTRMRSNECPGHSCRAKGPWGWAKHAALIGRQKPSSSASAGPYASGSMQGLHALPCAPSARAACLHVAKGLCAPHPAAAGQASNQSPSTVTVMVSGEQCLPRYALRGAMSAAPAAPRAWLLGLVLRAGRTGQAPAGSTHTGTNMLCVAAYDMWTLRQGLLCSALISS